MKEKQLLEKLEVALQAFLSVNVAVGASPVIGKVVEVLAELAVYLKERVESEK